MSPVSADIRQVSDILHQAGEGIGLLPFGIESLYRQARLELGRLDVPGRPLRAAIASKRRAH